MKLNQRESTLLAFTLTVIMAVSGFLLIEQALEKRREVVGRIAEARAEIARRQAVIDQNHVWVGKLQELRASLPSYPPRQDVTTDLLNLLETTAGRHNLTLLRRDAERERRDGELYELTINCRWRGSLQSLVYFLFDLQQQGVRLGVRQLSISPRGRDQLEGTMTIAGAYSRQVPANAETAALSMSP